MYKYNCEIIKVVDGDTIDIRLDLGFSISIYERVRVKGVDTPETRTRDLIEKKAGLMAKEFVLKHLPEGSMQVCLTSKDTGKFGRYLADFKCGASTLTQELIKNHLAVAYHGQAKADIKANHLENYKALKLIK